MNRILTGIAIIILLNHCNNKAFDENAEQYMNQIISETYNDMFLPDLEPADISVLLNYRHNKKILKNHPVNPISSMIGDSVTVGIIALWTIESIRFSELNGDSSEYKRFPSLNPSIKDTLHQYLNKFSVQDSAAMIYYNWWNNKKLTQAEKLKTNPLKGTNLVWR